MANKIKKGDTVIVIAGRSKGIQGKVLRIINKICKNGKKVVKVLVEGVNLVKKHVKPDPNANNPGGIVEREAPIDISNIAIFNPVTKKPDRVGFRILEDGRKVRCFKSNNELVDI